MFRTTAGTIAAPCLFVLVAALSPAQASTIIPQLWEQVVDDTDFVGIVECETAGGIVAKFRVVEAWKGSRAGAVLTIDMGTDVFGDPFRTALCGDRYLFAAKSLPAGARVKVGDVSVVPPVPLWHRSHAVDHRVDAFQGRVRNPASAGQFFFDAPYRNLAEFKAAVTKFVSMDPEDREKALLRAVADRHLFGARPRRYSRNQNRLADDLITLKAEMDKATTASQMATIVMRYGRSDQGRMDAAARVLRTGGGAETLKILESWPEAKDKERKSTERWTIIRIKRRLGQGPKPEPFVPQPPKKPTEKQLNAWRESLAKDAEMEAFTEAIEKLALHEPATAADALVTWVRREGQWAYATRSHDLASTFARLCSKDRKTHLGKLLKSNDPFVRVAGAVYLCFEDDKIGQAKLAELSKLKGDPGAWAALNLARRGDKQAMGRVLELFKTAAAYGTEGHIHGNLQKRAMILLSNSAKAAKLPQPPDQWRQYRANDSKVHPELVKWWQTHRDRIRLIDPWLKDMAAQKVD